MKSVNKKYLFLGLFLICLILFLVYWFGFRNSKMSTENENDYISNVENSNQNNTNSTIVKPKICVIPTSLKLSDLLGNNMEDLANKYRAEFKVYENGYAQNIMCENEMYKVNIMSTNKDLVANYVIMELKEFGYCKSGIENVKGWVDKSLQAVGLNSTTKGSSEYDTEDNRSNIIYEKYNFMNKNVILSVSCNITGGYIAVSVISTN